MLLDDFAFLFINIKTNGLSDEQLMVHRQIRS